MEIDVLVLHDATQDDLADRLGEALAERGVSMHGIAAGEPLRDARVLVPLIEVDPDVLAAALSDGLAILPGVADGGWLAGDTDARARRIADAVDALLIIGRPRVRSTDETVLRAETDVRASLEDDGERSPLGRICEAFSLAIQWGAPIYNRGAVEACARIYRSTASAVRRFIDERIADGEGELLDAIAFELTAAEESLAALAEDAWDEQAWTLRHTFDRILAARRTADALRNIDDLFAGLVRAGRRANASLVYDIISVSISHGAPIYNSGSPVGCAQIYVCTAAGLLRLLGAEPRSGEGRTEPLARETLTPLVAAAARRLESDADGLAWSLRGAFDRLVETAARERTWEHDS